MTTQADDAAGSPAIPIPHSEPAQGTGTLEAASGAGEGRLTVGLIGSGVLAVPILTGSGAYAVAESFGWKYGLDKRPQRATQFYGVIAASTAVAMLINFIGLNPIQALVWAAILNDLLAPPLLVVILLVGNNHRIMGARRNGRFANVLEWITAALMAAAAIALLTTLL